MRFYSSPDENDPVKPKNVRLRLFLGGFTISCLLIVMGFSWHAGVTVSRLDEDYETMVIKTASLEESFGQVEELQQAMHELRYQKSLYDAMLAPEQRAPQLRVDEIQRLTHRLPEGIYVDRIHWESGQVSIVLYAVNSDHVVDYMSLMHGYGYRAVRSQPLPEVTDRGAAFIIEGQRGGDSL